MAATYGGEKDRTARKGYLQRSPKPRWESRGSVQPEYQAQDKAYGEDTDPPLEWEKDDVKERLAPSSKPRRHEHPSKERLKALQNSHQQ